MRISILVTTILLALGSPKSFAQQSSRRCGAEVLQKHLQLLDAEAYSKYRSNHAALAASSAQNMEQILLRPSSQVLIPVVFHVILTPRMLSSIGGVVGLEARIDSQMKVINRDFNAENENQGSIPSAFRRFVGNPSIQFGLAEKTPTGSASSGYTLRIITASEDSVFDYQNAISGSGIGCSDAKYNGRGTAIWDINCYLNVWVTSVSNNIFGITISPLYAQDLHYENERGVVMDYHAFGKRTQPTDPYFTNIDLGRTLTHELGHYFELFHVWGDDGGACPGQSGYFDDDINDTPVQAGPNSGCPTFPRVSCTAAAPAGDMFMNYMDYSDDRCLTMFTRQQSALMLYQTTGGQPSYSLAQCRTALSSKGLLKPQPGMYLFPNPATHTLQLNLTNVQGSEVSFRLMAMHGEVVYFTDKIESVNAGNGNISINVAALPRGIYLAQCIFASGTIMQKVVLQ